MRPWTWLTGTRSAARALQEGEYLVCTVNKSRVLVVINREFGNLAQDYMLKHSVEVRQATLAELRRGST